MHRLRYYHGLGLLLREWSGKKSWRAGGEVESKEKVEFGLASRAYLVDTIRGLALVNEADDYAVRRHQVGSEDWRERS